MKVPDNTSDINTREILLRGVFQGQNSPSRSFSRKFSFEELSKEILLRGVFQGNSPTRSFSRAEFRNLKPLISIGTGMDFNFLVVDVDVLITTLFFLCARIRHVVTDWYDLERKLTPSDRLVSH